jgi:hypothetical protein
MSSSMDDQSTNLKREHGSSHQKRTAAHDSPSLSPADVDFGNANEEEDEDESEEGIADTLVMMGAGEPVKTNSGSNGASERRMTRVLSGLHEDTDDDEKASRSLRLAVKTKVLHFTVSVDGSPLGVTLTSSSHS